MWRLLWKRYRRKSLLRLTYSGDELSGDWSYSPGIPPLTAHTSISQPTCRQMMSTCNNTARLQQRLCYYVIMSQVADHTSVECSIRGTYFNFTIKLETWSFQFEGADLKFKNLKLTSFTIPYLIILILCTCYIYILINYYDIAIQYKITLVYCIVRVITYQIQYCIVLYCIVLYCTTLCCS